MTRVQRMAAVITGIVMTATGSGVGFYNYKRTLPHAPEAVEVVQAPAPAVVVPPPPTPAPQTIIGCGERQYTVVKGDTLTGIAIAQWGPRNAFQYRKIWHDNAEKVKNPNRIYPGQVLAIKDCIEKDETPVTAQPVHKPVAKRQPSQSKHSAAVAPIEPAPAPQAVPELPKQVNAEPQASAPPAVPTPTPAPAPQQVQAQHTPAPKQPEGIVLPKNEVSIPPELPKAESAPPSQQVREVGPPHLLPGSAWDSLGTYPVEKDNIINQFHVEQAYLLAKALGFNIEPYVSVDVVKDSKEYPWNNKTKGSAGLRLQKSFGHGVINTNFAYAVEQRRKLDHSPQETRKGFMLSNDGWFGYDQPVPHVKSGLFRSTPGTLWWTAGNISPFEQGNWIVLARGEQGISLAKTASTYFIPLGWVQAGYDTKGFSWNRRLTTGGGMQVKFPWNTGVVGVTGGYECTRTLGGSSASVCGPTVKMDVWTGWLGHIGGGKK